MACTSAACNLQSTLNRFSNDPNGYAPIAVDGVIGDDTFAATLIALDIVRSADPASLAFSSAVDADALWNAINSSADVAANISGIMGVLSPAADALGYGAVPAPVTTSKSPPVTHGITTPKTQQKINAGTSLLGLGLPNWAVYGSGVVAVLGAVYWLMKHKKKTAGVSGYRRRR
jgi:hypothetical protein